MTRYKSAMTAIVFAVFCVAGCGGGNAGPTVVHVTGLVKYKGSPVANLAIAFVPDNGPPATGNTDATGNFELTTNKARDGAVIGMHKVGISFLADEIPPMGGPDSGTKYTPPISPIPKKYADVNNSGLTAKVEADSAKNNFTFELTD